MSNPIALSDYGFELAMPCQFCTRPNLPVPYDRHGYPRLSRSGRGLVVSGETFQKDLEISFAPSERQPNNGFRGVDPARDHHVDGIGPKAGFVEGTQP